MRYNIDNERQETPKGTSRKEINTMIKVYFNGLTEYGSCIYDAVVFVPEDYTMNQLVSAIKEEGYSAFMLPSMRRFVKI
nr:MAG TPA_asm: hypothetical protein [Caudoviricetes sp.]